ncbi:MAG: hypothetical protein ACREQY_21960 [Candidatus Binatia bacterium]
MRVKAMGSVVFATIVALSPVLSYAQFTSMVGSGVADDQGNCAIDIPVDPAADPQYVADELKEYLTLSGGATIQSISVENGVAHIECANAIANSTVEAQLPTDVASTVGAGGAAVEEGGVAPAAIIGGGALAAAGVGLGICAGVGCFDGDDNGIPATGER